MKWIHHTQPLLLVLTPGAVLVKLNSSGSWLKATFAQHFIMGNLQKR